MVDQSFYSLKSWYAHQFSPGRVFSRSLLFPPSLNSMRSMRTRRSRASGLARAHLLSSQDSAAIASRLRRLDGGIGKGRAARVQVHDGRLRLAGLDAEDEAEDRVEEAEDEADDEERLDEGGDPADDVVARVWILHPHRGVQIICILASLARPAGDLADGGHREDDEEDADALEAADDEDHNGRRLVL